MTWPIKVIFRPNADKELTKSISIESTSTIFTILMQACDIYDIKDKHSYCLKYKTSVLNLFETMIESKIVQGSTLNLIKRIEIKEKKQVSFNYKINADTGVIKSVCKYNPEEIFINCLQNITIEPFDKLNSLKHPSKLPVVSILSTKIHANDIIRLKLFSIESLGLRGNYSVAINYEYSNEDYCKFKNFLVDFNVSQTDSEKYQSLEFNNDQKLPTITKSFPLQSSSCLDNGLNTYSEENNAELIFTVLKPSLNSESSPYLPDSFYELSKSELLDFQKSLQTKSKSFSDRPLLSAKNRINKENRLNETAKLKIIFPDQIQVHVDFTLEFKVQAIVNFINTQIFALPVNNIELWIGPPYHVLKDLSKSLHEVGINGPTRVVIKCDNYLYRSDLKF